MAMAWDADVGSAEASNFGLFRLRFYQFNMNRKKNLSTYQDLVGPHGGEFLKEVMCETPFPGCAPVDVAFAVFTETRLKVTPMARKLQEMWKSKPPASGLDSTVNRNAVKARLGQLCFGLCARSGFEGEAQGFCHGCCAKCVTPHTGNVKTLLAFRSARLRDEAEAATLAATAAAHSRLTAFFSPNPEKAILGTSVVALEEGIRLGFVGTHFPMQQLTAVLKRSGVDGTTIIDEAKRVYAKFLRQVMVEVSQWGLADLSTIIFLQGDLNSRTVFSGREAKDVLLELLRDEKEQSSIADGLPIPKGRWREIIQHDGIDDLPVTYKFGMGREVQLLGNACAAGPQVMMGDVLGHSTLSLTSTSNANSNIIEGEVEMPQTSEYRQRILTLGNEQLKAWGFPHTADNFKDQHFPACTDRILFWAPDSLASRMSWEFPHGGYQVLQCQEGSDHRPVLMEAVLKIGPEPPARGSKRLGKVLRSFAGLPTNHFSQKLDKIASTDTTLLKTQERAASPEIRFEPSTQQVLPPELLSPPPLATRIGQTLLPSNLPVSPQLSDGPRAEGDLRDRLLRCDVDFKGIGERLQSASERINRLAYK